MKSAHTEEEINLCQYTEAKQYELMLKEREDTIRGNLKGLQLERFNAAQALWRASAEKDCEFEADFYEGASIYVAIQSQCFQAHYQKRLEAIQSYLCPQHNYTSGCDPENHVNKGTASLERPPASAIPELDHSTTTIDAANSSLPVPAAKPKKITNTKRFR